VRYRLRDPFPPRSSNRPCGFPASGFPIGLTTYSRHGVFPPQVSQAHQVSPNTASMLNGPMLRGGNLRRRTRKFRTRSYKSLDHAVRGVVGSGTEVVAQSPQRTVQRAVPRDSGGRQTRRVGHNLLLHAPERPQPDVCRSFSPTRARHARMTWLSRMVG
jgi:hypothetical protein